VYSLGCILNECWTRQQPWRDSSHFFQVLPLSTLGCKHLIYVSASPETGIVECIDAKAHP
jgi:hypothetical protein